MNRYLLKSTIVAALGGLLFGFDTVVISGATSTLSEVYQLTPMLLGFTVASALLGTVLGSMFAGAPSDRYGRRQCLQALAVLYVITALGCAWRGTGPPRVVPLHRRTGHRRPPSLAPCTSPRPRRQPSAGDWWTLPIQHRRRDSGGTLQSRSDCSISAEEALETGWR